MTESVSWPLRLSLRVGRMNREQGPISAWAIVVERHSAEDAEQASTSRHGCGLEEGTAHEVKAEIMPMTRSKNLIHKCLHNNI